jgi:SRSO17 transposase
VRERLPRLQELPWDPWLPIQCSLRDAADRAYYVVYAPTETTLGELAGVAGLRWTNETCFGTAQEKLGLDPCEARSWDGWHRPMTLCMAALAFLAGLQAELSRAAASKPDERSPDAVPRGRLKQRMDNSLPQHSIPEIRYFFARLVLAVAPMRNLLLE